MVDLSALEGKIGALCDAAKEAPPAERERVILALEKLIGALDDLTKELTRQFGALGGETDENLRGKAANAYAQNTPKKSNGQA